MNPVPWLALGGGLWALLVLAPAGQQTPNRDSPLARLVAWLSVRQGARHLGSALAVSGYTATLDQIVRLKLTLAVAAAAAGAAVALTAQPGAIPALALVLTGAIAGYGVPDAWIVRRAARRRQDLERDLPPFLLTVAAVAEGGLHLPRAVEFQVRNRQTLLSRELALTMAEIHLGRPLAEAYLTLARRWRSAELNRFVMVLIQAHEKGGTGVAQILRRHAESAWDQRRRRVQEHGHRASVHLFLLLLLVVLPSVMIIVIAPSAYWLLQSLP